ncbi:hypothetical protein GMRT_10889 [Giardia muris]|uniref:Uncharacterized protein n=1 Tax=Giardia muris TaxID=5742 RepID=A0A4Z1T663_GIAMU|nr:hypothetical protein GMRT_10889 [Giardia muris]|eukprot:TNJ28627.1 hypothetical protein GMRT_10889 [Giardia muris]
MPMTSIRSRSTSKPTKTARALSRASSTGRAGSHPRSISVGSKAKSMAKIAVSTIRSTSYDLDGPLSVELPGMRSVLRYRYTGKCWEPLNMSTVSPIQELQEQVLDMRTRNDILCKKHREMEEEIALLLQRRNALLRKKTAIYETLRTMASQGTPLRSTD